MVFVKKFFEFYDVAFEFHVSLILLNRHQLKYRYFPDPKVDRQYFRLETPKEKKFFKRKKPSRRILLEMYHFSPPNARNQRSKPIRNSTQYVYKSIETSLHVVDSIRYVDEF